MNEASNWADVHSVSITTDDGKWFIEGTRGLVVLEIGILLEIGFGSCGGDILEIKLL